MVETKKIKACVIDITEKSGNTNGKDWKLFNYKVHVKDVGNRYMSTFHVIENVPINKEVEIEYREKPNPKKPEFPNLEIESITWDKANVAAVDMTEPEFKKGYLERADLTNLQKNHFIGSYVRCFHKDIADKALKLFESK